MMPAWVGSMRASGGGRRSAGGGGRRPPRRFAVAGGGRRPFGPGGVEAASERGRPAAKNRQAHMVAEPPDAWPDAGARRDEPAAQVVVRVVADEGDGQAI